VLELTGRIGFVPRDPRLLEPRDRLLAPVAVRDAAGNVVGANLGALIRRLLLFEQVVLDSYAMRELPALIDALGPEGFLALLESGALKIRADGWTFGETGAGGLVLGRGADPLPPLSYALSALVPHDRKHHISLCLSEIRAMPLPKRTSQKLRLGVVDALVPFPDDAGRKSLAALPSDLTGNLNLVRAATAAALTKLVAQPVGEQDFEIRIEQEDEHVFTAVTDIEKRLALSLEQTDKAVQDALLAIAGINQRIEEMESYEAVTGFRENELPIAEKKLSYLARQLDPEAQEERFGRVITIAGLPDPETVAGAVNVERLLEVRESRELREFRQWLRTLDNASDEEIAELVGSISAKVSEAVHSPAGKAIRFVASTLAGAIPIAGPIAGVAVSALDTFLLEKIIPEPGPVSFIGTSYPSIFEGK
jgi:hypothetical protein